MPDTWNQVENAVNMADSISLMERPCNLNLSVWFYFKEGLPAMGHEEYRTHRPKHWFDKVTEWRKPGVYTQMQDYRGWINTGRPEQVC